MDLARGLDWKRAFGLQLWYGLPMDAPLADVFDAYDTLWKEGRSNVAPPAPWYAERPDSADSLWKLPREAQHPDALYLLIKLAADPDCNLSEALSSFSFSPSPTDYRLPWHLYILLSRCLRVRDLADRDTSVRRRDQEDDDGVEGHSPSADLLANSYASQLEQLGMIQEAVFVLLHVEGSAGYVICFRSGLKSKLTVTSGRRVKVIKELLTRSAAKLDDWVTRGLVGSLKIPVAWINEAKVRDGSKLLVPASSDLLHPRLSTRSTAGRCTRPMKCISLRDCTTLPTTSPYLSWPRTLSFVTTLRFYANCLTSLTAALSTAGTSAERYRPRPVHLL